MTGTRDRDGERDEIIRLAKELLLGPREQDETIQSAPADTYLTGILWPAGKLLGPMEDEENDGAPVNDDRETDARGSRVPHGAPLLDRADVRGRCGRRDRSLPRRDRALRAGREGGAGRPADPAALAARAARLQLRGAGGRGESVVDAGVPGRRRCAGL